MKFKIDELTDIHKLGITYAIGLVIFFIVFFKENPIITIITFSAMFWIFVMPGITITYLWKMNFLERIAISIAISSAIMGISSYYLGLVGLHVGSSSIILPPLFMIIGFLFVNKEKWLKK
ncbi:MAG: hypothetical protein KAS04_00910 [Candidatus Aenigmarchaeota archaeon]|nr:hypothetical protein [Candidatus Aenigmarchaeota archaeon]